MPIDDAALGLRTRQIRLTAFSLEFIGYHIAATMVWGKCIAYAIAAELGSQFHNIGKDVSPAPQLVSNHWRRLAIVDTTVTRTPAGLHRRRRDEGN